PLRAGSWRRTSRRRSHATAWSGRTRSPSSWPRRASRSACPTSPTMPRPRPPIGGACSGSPQSQLADGPRPRRCRERAGKSSHGAMTRVRVLLVAAVLLSATAGRAAKDAKQTIQYDDDRLTLRVEEALAADILQEVARQSGAEVRGQIPTTRRVSAEFEHAPLKDGLERVLGAQNFTLTYAGEGRLKTIELKGVPEEGQAARAVVAVDPASASAPARASTSPPGCIPTSEEAKRR